MIEQPAILSLFGDKSMLDRWKPLLDKFPGRIVTWEKGERGMKCLDTGIPGFIPRLVIISYDLYSDRGKEIIECLRAKYSPLEIAVLAPGEIPQIPFQSLIVDKIHHFTIADPLNDADRTCALIRTLAANEAWELSSYLNSNSNYHEFQLFDPGEKESILREIEQLTAGTTPGLELLRQKSALLADEMIENALEAAPSGAISRQGISIKVGFDGDALAMQVKDNWGTLTPDNALQHLAQDHANGCCMDHPRGRGLFILWQFFDHFHVNIASGRETAIGGQVKLKPAANSGQLKGFNFFQDSSSGTPPSLSLFNTAGGYANV
jgi:anti-sigma regulatory factor (Ser/Thr protein kinase)